MIQFKILLPVKESKKAIAPTRAVIHRSEVFPLTKSSDILELTARRSEEVVEIMASKIAVSAIGPKKDHDEDRMTFMNTDPSEEIPISLAAMPKSVGMPANSAMIPAEIKQALLAV